MDIVTESIQGRVSLAAKILEVTGAARYEIRLQSFDLDAALYGSDAFKDSIKNFLLASERANLHVLLNQPRRAVLNAPRLAELGRRMTSRVEFRQLSEQDIAQIGERLIVDINAVIERASPEASLARFSCGDRAQALHNVELFDALWTRASGASEFRALSL